MPVQLRVLSLLSVVLAVIQLVSVTADYVTAECDLSGCTKDQLADADVKLVEFED